LHVDTRLAADPDQLGTQGWGWSARPRRRRLPQTFARPARREGGVDSDHILATKRYDRGRAIHAPTVIPCRDPTSGIRHLFDLVTTAAPFKRCADGGFKGNRFVEQKHGDRTCEPSLERRRRKTRYRFTGRGPMTGLRPGTSE